MFSRSRCSRRALLAIVALPFLTCAGAKAQSSTLTADEVRHARQQAQLDLSRAAGNDQSARPSVLGGVVNTVQAEGDHVVFICKAEDETIAYHVAPEAGLLEPIEVRIDGRALSTQPFVANPLVLTGEIERRTGENAGQKKVVLEVELRLLDGESADADQTGRVVRPKLEPRLIRASLEEDVLVCRYEYEIPDVSQPVAVDVRFRAVGKTLSMELASDSPRLVGFQVASPVGDPVPVEFGRTNVRYLASDEAYVSAFPDVWLSDASGVGRDRVIYNPLTDGTRHPLRDTFHLTVTSRYAEAFGSVPFEPSPYLEEFSRRVYIDIWEGSFAESKDWLEELHQYDVDHAIVLKHAWQRKGFDRSWPKGYPANEGLGGDEGLRELSLRAQELGHRFGIHENLYDPNPSIAEELWRPEDITLKSDGSLLGHIGDRFFLLKPSRHLEYASVHTGEVVKRYGLNAIFHDVMPRPHVDYDASVPESGKIRSTLEHQVEYFHFARDLVDGPALTEMTSAWLAGAWDGGINAYVDNMSNRKPLVAFELLKVHPRMVNQGVGYYERWLPQGSSPGWEYYNMTDREMDRYRALTVAFGRMGVILRQINNLRNTHAAVREYYLMQAFGRAYTGQRVVHLAYDAAADGEGHQWIDAATAARHDRWQRLRVTYEDGQDVYVNYDDAPWDVAGQRLPGWGSMTTGPRGTAMTAVVDGQIADFARYDDVTYADARSHVFRSPSGEAQIRPALGEWKDNGDGSFDLSVNWDVGRELEHDFHSFWEFKAAGAILSRPVLGGAHPITGSTSEWEVGQVYVDGPHRVKIPEGVTTEVMELIVGMTHPKGYATRPRLYDIYNKVRIARLHVAYDDGKVESIRFEEAEPLTAFDTSEAVYRKDANVDGRVLDFGEVATDGAVVLRDKGQTIELIPVPIGEQMTVGLAGAVRDVRVATGAEAASLSLERRAGKTWFTIPAGASRLIVEREEAATTGR